MPELPLKDVDDLVTDVINDHISKSFSQLQDTVLGILYYYRIMFQFVDNNTTFL